MKATELILELQNLINDCGDVEVKIYASYDCGYAYAGGNICDVKFVQSGKNEYIELVNDEG